LQDFTTQSRTAFAGKTLLQINVAPFDALKHRAKPLIGDAALLLKLLHDALPCWKSEDGWLKKAQQLNQQWQQFYDTVTANPGSDILPSDAQVLGAVKRQSEKTDVVVCAAGGLPGELHKLWRAEGPGTYHVEYGFSCMGYEIAGALGVKIASPAREVFVVVGDGSYLMMNSELATSVMLGHKIIVVLLDNSGYGCINRLQKGTGNAAFNNLLQDCEGQAPAIDFAAHARALGALSETVGNISELEQAIGRARAASKSYLIEIKTDPQISTDNGTWWDVAIPQVSEQSGVRQALSDYQQQQQNQPY